jgi:hypothetical protein
MRERASQVRAKLTVRSAPGKGTKVVLHAPSRPGGGTVSIATLLDGVHGAGAFADGLADGALDG